MSATAGGGRRQSFTREELLALPASIDLNTANRALAIGRSTGYALARRGEYPVQVLRFGNAYRVATADLHRLLGIVDAPAEDAAPTAEAAESPTS